MRTRWENCKYAHTMGNIADMCTCVRMHASNPKLRESMSYTRRCSKTELTGKYVCATINSCVYICARSHVRTYERTYVRCLVFHVFFILIESDFRK